MISGLNSAGVDVADLRVLPSPVARHLLKTHGYDAGFHIGVSQTDPEAIQIRFFEQPGIQMTTAVEKEIEKHFNRRELRRVPFGDIGSVTYPARTRESYAQDLLSNLDAETIRARGFRIVVDYGHSSSSFVLPLMLGPLGVEAISAHGFTTEAAATAASLRESIGQAKQLVGAIGADFGAVFDRAGERLFLVDERGREISVEQTLLLYLKLIGSHAGAGKIAVPITVTRRVEQLAGRRQSRGRAHAGGTCGADANRLRGRRRLRRRSRRRLRLPAVSARRTTRSPACASCSSCSPRVEQPLSELVAELPASTVVHRQLACPWALKGLVMRVLTERLKDRQLDLTDGIKVIDERGWVEVLPDPDEPQVHIYAEGENDEASAGAGGESCVPWSKR